MQLQTITTNKCRARLVALEKHAACCCFGVILHEISTPSEKAQRQGEKGQLSRPGVFKKGDIVAKQGKKTRWCEGSLAK